MLLDNINPFHWKKYMNFINKIVTALAVTSVLTGCGGLGSLASNPRVSDADNDQVVFLGDSIFALSGSIQDRLEDYAGETFRSYTISAAEITGGILATSIENQFKAAARDNSNIETVVMDGGGNDLLIPALALFDPHRCKTPWWRFGRLSSSCKAFVEDIYVEVVSVLNGMDAQGVDNVVYLGYYHPKNALLRADNLEEAVDYGDLWLARACTNSTVDCAFVDPRSVINDRDIFIDGIHPTWRGSVKQADLIWPVLEPLL